MGGEIQDGVLVHAGLQLALLGGEALQEPVPFLASMPKSLLIHNGRPNSMVVKKPREPIPPHIVAEAISTLHGLDLRWSGPITPSERQYVEQYVLAKYPQYSHGLVEEGDKTDLYSIFLNDDDDETCSRPEDGAADQYLDRRRTSPRGGAAAATATAHSPSFGGSNLPDPVEKTRLEPSRLLDILTKKASFPGSFVSIPEIHARNRVLGLCGLAEEDYLVLFTPGHKEAMMLVGESYPFFRYNYYMTTLQDQDREGRDCVREFASYKEAKVIAAPADWLDLRIKGSQLSQYFRRKCKHRPKGLFAYAAAEKAGDGGGRRNSMHWVSEAHRNGWHVLLDASSSGAAVGGAGEGRLNLALHRPDFVLCTLDNAQRTHPPTVTCLLVRREAFDTSTVPPPP